MPRKGWRYQKGQSEAVNRRETGKTLANRKKEKGQIIIYKTPHRKQNIEQHESYL